MGLLFNPFKFRIQIILLRIMLSAGGKILRLYFKHKGTVPLCSTLVFVPLFFRDIPEHHIDFQLG